PAGSSLLGLVSRLAPVIVSGNTAVVVATETRPLPAITLAEVLATSDLPGGVVNLLTGFAAELAGPLAGHMDVGALDPGGLHLAQCVATCLCTRRTWAASTWPSPGRRSWPRPRTSSGSPHRSSCRAAIGSRTT